MSFGGRWSVTEHDVIEAAREVARACESEAMADRNADATWRRSARESRAVAVARLKQALAVHDAAPPAGPPRPAEARKG